MDFTFGGLATRLFHPWVKPDHTDPTPYQQQPNHIPHLFTSEQERCTTAEWLKRLRASPSDYETCKVVSLTVVKALASPLSHEFVQFIVEDSRNGTRTRVFSDRQKDADHVIVGWNWSSRTNPSGQEDIPLPLVSIDFNNGRPSVLNIAEILAKISSDAPKYTLIHMCWWYADTVYKAAKLKYMGTEKRWTWYQYKYELIIYKHLWQQLELEKDAEEFHQQNVTKMNYLQSSKVPTPITTEQYLKKIVNQLKSEERQEEYQEALRLDDNEKLDTDTLTEALPTAEDVTKALKSSSEKIPSSLDLVKDAKEFSEAVLDDPEKEANLKAYDEAWEKYERRVNNVPDDLTPPRTRDFYAEPLASDHETFDRAMEVHIGSILRKLKEEEK